MTTAQSPIAYAVQDSPSTGHVPAQSTAHETLRYRTSTRALLGMQKEALVHESCSGKAWRLLCDEGPYLNGTDAAPFPLGYFCAGMVSSVMTELLVLLRQHHVSFSELTLLQDNRYSMQGSATAGTMVGAALPVELQLYITSPTSAAVLQGLLMQAVAAAPAMALLRQVHANTFSICHNGKPLEPQRILACTTPSPTEPTFSAELVTAAPASYAADCVTKLKAAPVLAGVSGGAGSSLTNEQKRILHMRGACTLRADGLQQIDVELFSPLGSQFRFLAEESSRLGGQGRAPSSLVYLSAGLAFCFMTQMGRYASIVKKILQSYQLLQDTEFSLPGASANTGQAASMQAIRTHVYLQSAHADEYAQTLVAMSEQTCFLHAACREVVAVRLKEAVIATSQ